MIKQSLRKYTSLSTPK